MADLITQSEYEKYAIRKPDMGLFPKVKGREPIMTYLNDKLFPGVPYHIDMSFITSIPEPHIFEHSIDYDRIYIFWSTDHKNPQSLGATIECYIGGQRTEFSNTTSLFIPKGMRLGPVNWLKVDRPHIMMEFVLGTGDSSVLTGSGIFEPKDGPPKKTDEIDYEQYVIRSPMREAGDSRQGPYRMYPTMTYMSSRQCKANNNYIEFGYIWDIVDPPLPRMTHYNFDEIVLHFGSDPDNPTDLGGHMRFDVGNDQLEFDTNYCIWLPKGVTHGPLVWYDIKKPFIEMAIMLNAGTVEQYADDANFEWDVEK
ncbi:MAG: hypothetical protein PVG39_08085 [Desulfobacteraceae bacterium]